MIVHIWYKIINILHWEYCTFVIRCYVVIILYITFRYNIKGVYRQIQRKSCENGYVLYEFSACIRLMTAIAQE